MERGCVADQPQRFQPAAADASRTAAPHLAIAARWFVHYAQPVSTFPVSIEKEDQLAQRMAALGVRESDIEESFVRSGGHGGQDLEKGSPWLLPPPRAPGV